jgi:hypothetical protein
MKMRIRSLLTLLGLAISFASPTFAQQGNTPDPQLREQILALVTKFDPAFNLLSRGSDGQSFALKPFKSAKYLLLQ